MSDDYTIELSLTPYEAKVIYALTLRGIAWTKSGAMGNAAERISDALRDVLGDHVNTMHRVPDIFPIWEEVE